MAEGMMVDYTRNDALKYALELAKETGRSGDIAYITDTAKKLHEFLKGDS